MSTRKKPIKLDDPEQSKAFIEKAKEIGADEKKSAADELMRRLSERGPEPRVNKSSAKGPRKN